MALGAAFGLAISAFFVFSADNPNPEWGRFWMIRPLVVTPLAGAFGMFAFYLKDFIQPGSNTTKALVFVISLLGLIVALWMGTVLGFAGTMWN